MHANAHKHTRAHANYAISIPTHGVTLLYTIDPKEVVMHQEMQQFTGKSKGEGDH